MSKKIAAQLAPDQEAVIPNPSVSFDMHTVMEALEPHNITARFILVLESEANHNISVQVPRFTVGGPKANKQPDMIPLKELHQITKFDHGPVDVLKGWAKVHHFIYVVGEHTDINGWEYRSDWSDGPPGDNEEPWTSNRKNGALVRRRLWLCSCVRDDILADAKAALAAYLLDTINHDGDRFMRGDILRKEVGMFRIESFVKRHMVLYENRVEIFPDAESAHYYQIHKNDAIHKNDKIPEHDPAKVSVMMLRDVIFNRIYGEQVAPLREGQKFCHMFLLRDRRSDNVLCTLDCIDANDYRRWTTTLNLLLAINSFNVDFPPFEFGPPSEDLCPNRVIVYGHLTKKGHFLPNWRERFFHLTPFEIIYHENEVIKGRLMLQGAEILKYEGSGNPDEALDFTVRDHSGKQLTLLVDIKDKDDDRTKSAAEKRENAKKNAIEKRHIWQRYIQNEIDRLDAVQAKYAVKEGLSPNVLTKLLNGSNSAGKETDVDADSVEGDVSDDDADKEIAAGKINSSRSELVVTDDTIVSTENETFDA
jgi:hypothetical protein